MLFLQQPDRRNKIFRLHGQHRTIHLLKYVFGCIADEKARYADSADRAHDDEIDCVLGGQIGDLRSGISFLPSFIQLRFNLSL